MVTPASRRRSVAADDVVDPEVEQGLGSARFEEQAAGAQVEEGEPGRIEPGDEVESDDVAVEGDSSIHVLDVLSDLTEMCDGHGPEE